MTKATTKQSRWSFFRDGTTETFSQIEVVDIIDWNKRFDIIVGEFAAARGHDDKGYFNDLKDELEQMRSHIADFIKRIEPVIENAKEAKRKLESLDASLIKSHLPIFDAR